MIYWLTKQLCGASSMQSFSMSFVCPSDTLPGKIGLLMRLVDVLLVD